MLAYEYSNESTKVKCEFFRSKAGGWTETIHLDFLGQYNVISVQTQRLFFAGSYIDWTKTHLQVFLFEFSGDLNCACSGLLFRETGIPPAGIESELVVHAQGARVQIMG